MTTKKTALMSTDLPTYPPTYLPLYNSCQEISQPPWHKRDPRAKLEYSGGFSIGKNLNLKFLLLNIEIPQKFKRLDIGWVEVWYCRSKPVIPPPKPPPALASSGPKLLNTCTLAHQSYGDYDEKSEIHRPLFFAGQKFTNNSKLVILPLAIFHSTKYGDHDPKKKRGRPWASQKSIVFPPTFFLNESQTARSRHCRSRWRKESLSARRCSVGACVALSFWEHPWDVTPPNLT